ncbi:MAG TPA: efflux RND transporter periplasmic adaptor subunit [Steroidobacteraceae bacterium]|nr:efflux RND transporter periplasmic adaptor subunit [Steroidobacteraceae bacterium]
MIGKPRWKLLGLAAAVIAAGLTLAYFMTRNAPPHYVTAPVTRGTVATTITASGTINPEVTVQVGTFVSGVIQTLACDYNTNVKKGQLCAKIDPAPYQAIVDVDQADLATARAQLAKDQANLAYAKLNSERNAELLAQDSVSRDAADLALSAYQQAVAAVNLDAAQIQNKAAALRSARINLNYTNIISPVDGTVVARNVNAGQTVAASFQTPTLFLIANDLKKMQVDTNVSESDIAGAVQGAAASFTVDAYPKRSFHGRVAQVRQAPISVQNVITYDVVVSVSNPDLVLKPGMTATVRIVTAQATDVLRVPAQALRFTPEGTARPGVGTGEGVVWIARGDQPVAVPVTVGINDNTFVEIKSGNLRVGDPVILAQAATGAGRTVPTPSLRL